MKERTPMTMAQIKERSKAWLKEGKKAPEVTEEESSAKLSQEEIYENELIKQEQMAAERIKFYYDLNKLKDSLEKHLVEDTEPVGAMETRDQIIHIYKDVFPNLVTQIGPRKENLLRDVRDLIEKINKTWYALMSKEDRKNLATSLPPLSARQSLLEKTKEARKPAR